jgi:hypothetical protein
MPISYLFCEEKEGDIHVSESTSHDFANFEHRNESSTNSDVHTGTSNSPIKGQAIPVTGREGTEACETSGLPHFF